ncbi:MAG: hypothetical protein R6U10_01950, partial [Thermoplasmatota archaeon]
RESPFSGSDVPRSHDEIHPVRHSIDAVRDGFLPPERNPTLKYSTQQKKGKYFIAFVYILGLGGLTWNLYGIQ